MPENELQTLHHYNRCLAKTLSDNQYWHARYGGQLAQMLHCSHTAPAHRCQTALCLLCRRWQNDQESCMLSSRFSNLQHEQPNTKFLFATAAMHDVYPEHLRQSVQHATQSWTKMLRPLRGLRGSARVTEISTSTTASDQEHPHIHGILAVSPSAFSGRHRLSRKDWDAAWEKAAGTADSIEVKAVYDLAGIVNYMLPSHYYGDKGFLQAAENALADPDRYALRTREMYHLQRRRYCGALHPSREEDPCGLHLTMTPSTRRTQERQVAYEGSPHRSVGPKLIPVAA
jgi:Replication protein